MQSLSLTAFREEWMLRIYVGQTFRHTSKLPIESVKKKSRAVVNNQETDVLCVLCVHVNALLLLLDSNPPRWMLALSVGAR